MPRFLEATALVLALSSCLVAATDCSSDSKCSEDSPCCSQYGECGTGAYCLGGCDPLSSYSLNSCAPAPVCQNKTITFENNDGLISNEKYLGNASAADFVYSGSPLNYDNQVLLTMTESSSGTLLASTSYIWYGKATAKIKSSGGQGVVTAFILLSDVKDEIDYEFVGYNLTQVQTNYYFQGILDYDNGHNSSVSSNTMDNVHTYELDWTPDTLTWSLDGTTLRTLDRSATWNSTANSYAYPQTPSRLELSIWPAGSKDNAIGTVEWAGGYIDWNSSYMTNGYYYAAVESVTIECYDPPSGANVSGSKAYVYTNSDGLNSSVAITDDNTILSSFEATGLNETAGASASGAAASATSVPGQSGSGTGSNGQRGGSSSSGSGSATTSSSSSATSGFVQGGGSSSGAAALMVGDEKRLLMGSVFAVLGAVGGVMLLL